ncbi:MAG TPA: LacI family DNA-binding transcriptional regulator [Armatimonadota bacterium]|nr:LacI family DNA-binding transcriptional regulator [Armatimonadota bacterium]
MISIRKLAEIAGVSTTTVFRALHNTGRIKPETRQRLLELAALYAYQPPALAPSRSRFVGCLMSRLDVPFNAQLLRGISEALFAESYYLTVQESHCNLLHTRTAFQTFADLDVCGVIALSGHYEPIPTQSIFLLRGKGIPFVAVDASTPTTVPVDRVMSNEDAIAEIALEYLLALGHRRIGYLGPPVSGEHGRSTAVLRAMKKRGVPPDHFLDIVPVPWLSYRQDPHCAERLRDCLSGPRRPTAIFTFSDDMGMFVLKMALRLGLRVPRDVSVLGCSNFTLCDDFVIPLTSIEQFPDEIGRCAVRLLLARMTEQTADHHATTHCIAPRLVMRESCARVPR